MLDWTNVSEAVHELIELVDEARAQGERFRLVRVAVDPDPGAATATLPTDTLKVVAYDEHGRPFKYAMYVTRGRMIADAY